jgi:hypothetical protein
VPDQSNGEILQVLCRQARQHPCVDLVLAERPLILLQLETVEPCRYVHALHPRFGHAWVIVTDETAINAQLAGIELNDLWDMAARFAARLRAIGIANRCPKARRSAVHLRA